MRAGNRSSPGFLAKIQLIVLLLGWALLMVLSTAVVATVCFFLISLPIDRPAPRAVAPPPAHQHATPTPATASPSSAPSRAAPSRAALSPRSRPAEPEPSATAPSGPAMAPSGSRTRAEAPPAATSPAAPNPAAPNPAALNPAAPTPPAVQVGLALSSDRTTLRVRVDGAPAAGTVTVLLDGRVCETGAPIPAERELRIDLRVCRSARDGAEVTVAVEAAGRPARRWTADVTGILDGLSGRAAPA
ncbi:hypothetical protein ACFY36_35605 [Actinoplanes sp. NPDC000266]